MEQAAAAVYAGSACVVPVLWHDGFQKRKTNVEPPLFF